MSSNSEKPSTAASAPERDPRTAQWLWATFAIKNDSPDTIVLKDLVLIQGMLHTNGNPDEEISIEDVNNTVIPPSQEFKFSTSGVAYAPRGVEGSFNLYKKGASAEFASFKYSAPFLVGENKFEVQDKDPNYWKVEHEGANVAPGTGALGNVKIKVSQYHGV